MEEKRMSSTAQVEMMKVLKPITWVETASTEDGMAQALRAAEPGLRHYIVAIAGGFDKPGVESDTENYIA